MEDMIIEIIKKLTECEELDRNTDLLEEEILDSLSFIELIETLNNEFNIEIQPTQVAPNTWKNVMNIANLVNELKSN